jgi:Tol biopolymer transport system component
MGPPEGKIQNHRHGARDLCLAERVEEADPLPHELKHGPKARFNPSWSPNGKRIAYTKFKGDKHDCCVGDIFTMRADGSHRKPVSTSPNFEFRPDWGAAP